jgi:hypothetical protein
MPSQRFKISFPLRDYGTIGFTSEDAATRKHALEDAKAFATSFKDRVINIMEILIENLEPLPTSHWG